MDDLNIGDGTSVNERFTIKVFDGPSLVASSAAIVAEIESPSPQLVPSREILRLQKELYPFLPKLVLVLADDDTDFVSFVVASIVALHERLKPGAEPVCVTRSDNGNFHRIVVRFDDLEIARNTTLIGLEIAGAIFALAAGRDIDIQKSRRTIRRTMSEISGLTRSTINTTLSRLAGARGIATYPVSRSAGIYMLGQGANAFRFQEMANSQDSLLGWRLAKHKAVTSRFLQRLGFPTAEHKVATKLAAAHRIAREFGYPLVVKPTDHGKGTAVAVGIATDEELEAAFERARAASPGKQVLVERYVPGDDHRLSVFSGKLLRVSRLMPPHIVGDGKQTVAELIEAENKSRSDPVAASFFSSRLTIDTDMKAFLHKQGFALEDRPPQARVLKLRKTANLHTGGTREDVTAATHPDNISMAETIARNFHLDAIGIDFITPDIGKAWHETDCAIIEVNCNPGMSDEAVLEKVLLNKFPARSDGRIPSILIVGEGTELVDGIVHYVNACGRRVGHTDGARTQLAGQLRFGATARLPARILSLLLDASCEALVVACTADEIAEYGLPHTRYDLALIGTSDSLTDNLRELIEENSSRMIDDVTVEKLGEVVQPLLARIMGEYCDGFGM